MADHALITPPRPDYPREMPSLPAFLRAVRTNALLMWPDFAYERDVVASRTLGRSQMLLNAPGRDPSRAGRQSRQLPPHPRLDPHPPPDHRRGPAAQRGRGLEAPAPHHRAGAGAARHPDAGAPHRERHAGGSRALAPQAGEPVDLLAAMQPLALDIAGRSMFSLEMRALRPGDARPADELRRDLGRAATCSTWCCRAGDPDPARPRRRRFQARWMALIDRSHRGAARRPASRTARATCSTCCSPRAIPRPARPSPARSCATRWRP